MRTPRNTSTAHPHRTGSPAVVFHRQLDLHCLTFWITPRLGGGGLGTPASQGPASQVVEAGSALLGEKSGQGVGVRLLGATGLQMMEEVSLQADREFCKTFCHVNR